MVFLAESNSPFHYKNSHAFQMSVIGFGLPRLTDQSHIRPITISYSIDLGVLIPRYVKKGQSQYTEMISPNGYDPKRGFNRS